MQISVLYRTHAGDNAKRRPPWYDRAAALRSLQTAQHRAQQDAGVQVTVTFVVDRQMPAELAGRVRPEDHVVTITGGSASSSFRACVGVAVDLAETATPETLFWFAEDDYAYRPDAFSQLAAAVGAVDEADYFTLYVPDDSAWHAAHPSQPFRVLPPDEERRRHVAGREWHRVRQTTSTFGVRRAALLQDEKLLRLGSTVGAPFDAATWVALQGLRPFSWRHLLGDLDGYLSLRGLAKMPAKPVMRSVLNVVSQARRRPARILVAPREDLAIHLERDMVPPDAGWEDLGRA